MSYKIILVHCNDKRRVARIAAVGVQLADRFDAHLIGLSVSPPVHLIPAGMPGTPDVIVDDARCQAYRRDNPELRQAFHGAAGRAKKVVAEWRERDSDSASVSAVALAAARTSDLVVVAQKDPTWSHTSHLDIDDELILGSGRPVFLVPNDGLASAAARRVLVAWSGTREAARAVFDALPSCSRLRRLGWSRLPGVMPILRPKRRTATSARPSPGTKSIAERLST